MQEHFAYEDSELHHLSVRQLVEFVLKSGDLVHGGSMARLTKAIAAHVELQKQGGEEYHPEVVLRHHLVRSDIAFEFEGRADGIIYRDNEVVIDEIKTTSLPIEEMQEDSRPAHWGQVECYGYFFLKDDESRKQITLQLSYYQIVTGVVRRFTRSYSFEELENKFFCLLDEYITWLLQQKKWLEKRNNSIQDLAFPYPEYRQGQQEMARSVYQTILRQRKIFVQAPTGIGKTIASLFPALKAMPKAGIDKIFYLTAKNSTQKVAVETVAGLRERGLCCRSIQIQAKDKTCFCDSQSEEICPFTIGYYDRLNPALQEMFTADTFSRDRLLECAKSHHICPFEFSLDLSLWADLIICDYNYFFDPRVYLRRFFLDSKEKYVLLVDEAHNLVERSREMFSAEISKRKIMDTRKEVNQISSGAGKQWGKINQYLLGWRKLLEEENKEFSREKELPSGLDEILEEALGVSEEAVVDMSLEAKECYFELVAFLKIWEKFDENYITFVERRYKDLRIKLMCLDPAEIIDELLEKVQATIFFSATLLPMNYFVRILSGSKDDYHLELPSPFAQENFHLMRVTDVATTYRQRPYSYEKIANCIEDLVVTKKGNYFAFFPSYAYLDEVYQVFLERGIECETIIQSPSMSEGERKDFLAHFEEQDRSRSLIAFAVMGGIFGEGIDLEGEKLSGAVVVGVGLPQISDERDSLREFYGWKYQAGFEYAYVYPGINRVIQAAGRVIRSTKDRGVAILIDQRFTSSLYQQIVPEHWRDSKFLNSSQVRESLLQFHSKIDEP